MIMKALEENRYPFSDGKNKVEPVEGYYYAIATISQSTYRREEILSLLQVITDYFKSNQPDKLSLLKRMCLRRAIRTLERLCFKI